jgi:hypothetical protein
MLDAWRQVGGQLGFIQPAKDVVVKKGWWYRKRVWISLMGFLYAYWQYKKMQQQQSPPKTQIEFAQVIHAYTPPTPDRAEHELTVKQGELLALLDTTTNQDWWKVRSRDGMIGFIPRSHIKKVDHSVGLIKHHDCDKWDIVEE